MDFGGLRNTLNIQSYIAVSVTLVPLWGLGTMQVANQFQTRFLELIPRPIAGLKFSTLYKANVSPPRTPPPHSVSFSLNYHS
jgi:hypothetical protein